MMETEYICAVVAAAGCTLRTDLASACSLYCIDKLLYFFVEIYRNVFDKFLSNY